MNTRIPDCAVTFISSLLNIKKAEFSYMQDASCHEPNHFDDDNDDRSEYDRSDEGGRKSETKKTIFTENFKGSCYISDHVLCNKQWT